MAQNMFKHPSKASLPKLVTDRDYQLYKSRRNAYAVVTCGGLTLPVGEKTFDDLYARKSGKPTVNLESVSVNIKGDYGLTRTVKVSFTCYDRSTFLKFEKACLRPNRKVSVKYGYVKPAYGGGSESMDDLNVSGFNWSINDKNQYVCSFTAIGPTAVMTEMNCEVQIKDAGLTFLQPRVIGPPKTVPVSSLSGLIEHDAQQGTGTPTDTTQDGTYIPAYGGHIAVLDEPIGGLMAKVLAFLPGIMQPDPVKMTYVSLNYIVNRLMNDQVLSKSGGVMKGRKITVDASGYVIPGMCSGDPMKVVMLGGSAGNYTDPADPSLGKNWDPNGVGPVAYGTSLNAGNIMFNKDFVIEAFDKARVKMDTKHSQEKTAGGKSGVSGVSIDAFMGALFDKVKQASGGWFQLSLSEKAGASKTLSIINRNEGSGGVGPLTFDPINGDAVTRSTKIDCSPSANDTYQAMANAMEKEGTTATILSGEKRTPPSPSKSQCLATLKRHRTETAPGGFDDELVRQMESTLSSLVNALEEPELVAHSNLPYPLNLSVSLDGTAGFAFGDIVRSTALPAGLSSLNIVFRVTEVNHTIKNNDWQTDLTTICDVG